MSIFIIIIYYYYYYYYYYLVSCTLLQYCKKFTVMQIKLVVVAYSGLGIIEYVHGISILKRTLLDLETESEVTLELPRTWVCGRVGFPAKNFPKERVLCLFRVNHIPSILFILLLGAEWTEWYSVHSENGIAPKRTQIPSIPSIPIPE